MTSTAGQDAKERRRPLAPRGADAVLGHLLRVAVRWRERACGAVATRARASAKCLPLSAESTLPPLTSMVASNA